MERPYPLSPGQSSRPQAPQAVSGESSGSGAAQSPRQKEGPTKDFTVEAPTLSLPKGGGAIKGIEEKFEVNAANGTASFSIPLPISPARNGFTPQLALSYNSGGGNSPFGLGWSVGIPSITRKTEKQLPLYRDASDSDIYILSGAEDLVPLLVKEGDEWSEVTETITEGTATYQVKRYRPRIEGLFARTERWTDTATKRIHWRSISKENVLSVYGYNAESCIADPHDPLRIFEWLLCWSCDDKGSLTRYIYKQEDFAEVPDLRSEKNHIGNCSQAYLKEVWYGNQTPYYRDGENSLPGEANFPGSEDFLFKVILNYGDFTRTENIVEPEDESENPNRLSFTPGGNWIVRQDPFSSCRSGFDIRTYRRCTGFFLYHSFGEDLPQDPCLVKSMELTYRDELGLGESGQTVEGFSFLEKITQTGYRYDALNSSYLYKSLPPFEFEYQEHLWDSTIYTPAAKEMVHAPVGINDKQYLWTDLYGEGISGILTEQNGGWFYKENLGEGKFTNARQVAPKPSFTGLGGSLQVQELEGDGVKYFVQQENVPKGFFKLDPDNHWHTFRPFEQQLNVDMRQGNAKMVDLNGDGKSDLLISGDSTFTWYPSAGEKGFEVPFHVAREVDEEKGPAIVFADSTQSILLADLNGDGLTDIVRIRNGEVCYWPNLGYGKFGAKVHMDNSPVFDHPDAFSPSKIRLADVDGSGSTDLIYLDGRSFTIWMNLNGNGFATTPYRLDSLPQADNMGDITVTDFLGTGTSCIVHSTPNPGRYGTPLRYIDLTGGKKPHLMTAFINNTGKRVELEYASSTKFYLEDKRNGNPWVTKLPFPVHVLVKTVTFDTVAQLRFASEYSYHHGYYDYIEREFRGFGRVDQLDTERYDHYYYNEGIVTDPLDQVPVLTKTWFHTGFYTRRGKILAAYAGEYYQNPSEGFTEAALPDARLTDEDDAPLLKNDFELLRQAARACKSMLLRKEVYGLDGSEQEATPYAVEQHNCHIRLLQPQGKSKYAVFIPLESEAVTYSYERNPADPRRAHTLNLEIDPWGNVLKSLSVGYGRATVDAGLPVPILNEQVKTLCMLTENVFTNAIDHPWADEEIPVGWRTPLPAAVITSEITGLQPEENETYFTIARVLSELDTIDPETGLLDYHQTPTGDVQKRVVEHLRSLYRSDDGDDVLALGILEARALPYESYKLAYTAGLFLHLYQGASLSTMALETAGYVPFPGGTPPNTLWMPSGKPVFAQEEEDEEDLKARLFMPVAFEDPFGNSTTIVYDAHQLLTASITDALGNTTAVLEQDYRVLAPAVMEDINDNRSSIVYDALGLPVAVAMTEKDDDEADSLTGLVADLAQEALNSFFADPVEEAPALLGRATSRFVYDFTQTPVVVATIQRERHYTIANPDSPVQLAFEYSGGLGQVILQKAQAEPGKAWIINEEDEKEEVDTEDDLRWVGSGRTILNNKGNPVKQYEPYFSVAHTFEADDRLVASGVTRLMHYDPVGRLVRTDFPNGTFSKVEFDNWKQLDFDPNDTVEDSEWFTLRDSGALSSNPAEHDAATKAAAHYNTPSVTVLDSLGRPVLSRAQVGWNGSAPDYCDTYTRLDIEQQPVEVIDARGNTAVEFIYNMCGMPCYQAHIDSGERWLLPNVLNEPVWKRDAKGNAFFNKYDALNRPSESIVDNGVHTITFQKIIYGETATTPENNNLRGKPWKRYDGSGETVVSGYDFKGNPLSTTLKFTEDYDTLPDWSDSPTLESTGYTTSGVSDALSRPVSQTTPDGKETLYTYNEAGLLETVSVNDGTSVTGVVTNINYNSKGQREDIYYGNGAKTRYDYDPLMFRLARLLSTKDTGSVVLQDLNYTYDPVGNITWLKDDAQQALFFNNMVSYPENKYTYDSLYRLIEATGREKFDNTPFYEGTGAEGITFNNVYLTDPKSIQPYIRSFEYDPVGNILEMQHMAFSNNFTREFEYDAGNNLLQRMEVGGDGEEYTYDAHGNLSGSDFEPEPDPGPSIDRGYTWNELDQLASVNLIGGGFAYYNYNAAGQRTRTVIELSDGGKKIRKYIDSFEVYEEYDNSPALTLQRETLHISDDTGRICMLETRTSGSDGSPAELWRYIFSNHLQSATLELDENADIISYEEYYPFGGTSYYASNSTINAVAKRYKYSGKEKDEETGLYYYGARYHAPWLGRFISVDPKAIEYIHQGSYVFAGNNPVKYEDVNGEGSEDKIKEGGFELGITYRFGGKQESGTSIYASFTGISSKNKLGLEGGLRIGLNIYSNFKGKENITELTGAWYAGAVFGKVGTFNNKSIVGNEFKFAGSGISAKANGFNYTWGIGGVGLLTSDYKGSNISAYMGTQYIKGSYNTTSFTINHTNDALMVKDWLIKGQPPVFGQGTDWNRTTELSFNLSHMTSSTAALGSYRISLFTPPFMQDEKGQKISHPTGVYNKKGEEQRAYEIDMNSHKTFYSFNEIGLTMRGNAFQGGLGYSFGDPRPLIQNKFAHGNGYRFPLVNVPPELNPNQSEKSWHISISSFKLNN